MPDNSPVKITCPACSAINRIPAERLGDRPLCGKCRGALLRGEPLQATDGDFNRLVQNTDLPLVVDFWAPWCGPCQQFAPVFAQVAAEMPTRAVFIKLDTEANPATANKYQIRSIPTLMVLYRGHEITHLAGALPRSQLQQWLTQQLAGLGL
ncbi:thioredoxin TrxC [Microbulbifer yueqingensis]|uniref:Thioredoxin n=1 Tax=Microbulbifer yueqingensis TaxID=658219 RepID=A0A1G8ZHW3_9GAMM|nr:thioredoxin TrxC [Microbulbifer yueqingensis]SDK14637.1 thioredoxin [Microbulbifer yueqingensis]